MPHRTFTVDEVADYLHVSKADIERLVLRKEVPFIRQGSRIHFRQSDVDAWASRRILGLSAKQLTDYHKTASAKRHDLSDQHAIIPELVRPGHIDPALRAKTKSSVIRQMVELADRTELLNHSEDLLTGIEERERLCSTALDGGIALLHTKQHEPYISEDSFIVLGRTLQAIPFGSPDGRTTDLFFLLCTQDDRIHLHVLARLCMMCHHTSLLIALREAVNAEEMMADLVDAESEVIKGL